MAKKKTENSIVPVEVVNESKIPREYLTVNSVAINQAIRNGVREIDGLDIFQVEGLRV